MPIILPGSGYTLAEYRASLAAKGYDSADTATLDSAINEGRRRVLRDHRWTWLQSVATPLAATAGDAVVSLTAVPDLLTLDAVRLNYGQQEYDIQFLSAQQFRTKETEGQQSGVPYWWTQAGSAIRLYPTPDLDYSLTLDFATLPPDLVDADDTDDVPRIHADLVVWAAVPALGFRQREAWVMQYAESQYTTLLKAAVSQDNIEQRQNSRQVGDSGNRGRYGR